MECRARGYFLFPCCSHGEASLLHGLLSLGIFGRRQGQHLAGGQALPSTIFASRRRAVKDINIEEDGGGRGIRTPGTLSGTAVFKTACFNHSHIPPREDCSQFISTCERNGLSGISLAAYNHERAAKGYGENTQGLLFEERQPE